MVAIGDHLVATIAAVGPWAFYESLQVCHVLAVHLSTMPCGPRQRQRRNDVKRKTAGSDSQVLIQALEHC